MESYTKMFDVIAGVRSIKNGVSAMCARIDFVQPKFGYGVPDRDGLEQLIDFINANNIKQILSIGSGVGFVESIINKLSGANVICTDAFLSHSTVEHIKQTSWSNVEKLNHKDALDKYGYNIDCVFLNWPSMDEWPTETVKIAKQKNIKYVIYIGETSCCPCTGSDEMLEFLDNNFKNSKEIYFNTFNGINDLITIYFD
jgi:hypothetical protein